jgi:hypothetical protein
MCLLPPFARAEVGASIHDRGDVQEWKIPCPQVFPHYAFGRFPRLKVGKWMMRMPLDTMMALDRPSMIDSQCHVRAGDQMGTTTCWSTFRERGGGC